jgi:hypothetical protein
MQQSVMNSNLYEFYTAHAAPGRIGLIHLDFAPAKLINYGQKGLTKTGKSSLWVHAFLFTEQREGGWWIAESDVNVPLPGFRRKIDGPQENSIRKWSGQVVDRAAVLDAHLSEEQVRLALIRAQELQRAGYCYGLLALLGTWIAIKKKDLSYYSVFHRAKAMHCGCFVRECLMAAGNDPFGVNVLPENTAPELLYQRLSVIGEWGKA